MTSDLPCPSELHPLLESPSLESLAAQAGRLLDEARAEYQAHYGFVIFDVHPRVEGATVQVTGQVLLDAQVRRVRERLTPLLGDALDMSLEVLTHASTPPLAWAQPQHEWMSVFARPLATPPPAIEDHATAASLHLATQVLKSDPPVRVLAEQGGWRLVQGADATLGWVHECELTLVPPPTAAAWPTRPSLPEGATLTCNHEVAELVQIAEDFVGVPYILGGNHPTRGLDCSALMQRLFLSFEYTLPKHTRDQRKCGIRVGRAEIAAGDLLFFKGREQGYGHVGLALKAEGERVLHASRTHGKAIIESLEAMRNAYAYLGARRVVRFREARPEVASTVGKRPAQLPPIDLSDPATWIHRRVHVIGVAGAEGATLMRFLLGLGVEEVTGHDFSTADGFEKSFRLSHLALNPRERVRQMREISASRGRLCLRENYLDGIDQAELIFVPQGWFLYDSNAPLQALRERSDIVFSQMTDLYFRLAPCPILAVTGTNGKSTTTRLLADLLEASHLPLLFAGNDRRNVQVLDVLRSFDPRGRLVLEVSNRQLKDITPTPHVGVVTTVTPDHVEEHGSYEAYVAVKRKLVASMTENDYAVLNRDNPLVWGFAQATQARVLPFSVSLPPEGDGAWLVGDQLQIHWHGTVETICSTRELQVPGRHNIANVLAASLAAFAGGVSPDVLRSVVPQFTGIGLRLEQVASFGGVRYVNDIKATTPEACSVAVQAFDTPLLLIVGGGDKGLDYTALARLIVERVRHLLVLESAGGDRIQAAVEAALQEASLAGPASPRTLPPLTCTHHRDLAAAVAEAHAQARPGEVVLLSPACPGLFSMYIDESEGFGGLVAKLQASTP